MSVRCPECGAIADYGRELGHRTDCLSLGPVRTVLDIVDELENEAVFDPVRRRAADEIKRLRRLLRCERTDVYDALENLANDVGAIPATITCQEMARFIRERLQNMKSR